MLDKIAELDSSASHWIQNAFGGSFLETLFLFASNPYTWTPFLVFLVLLVMQVHAGKHWMVLLFGMGAFVIAFQFASWSSQKIERLAPFVTAAGHMDAKVFIHRGEQPWSLPDWATSALVAACFYSIFLLRKNVSRNFKVVLASLPVLLALARLQQGLCYPSDAIAAYLLGIFFAFILSRFPENLDTIFGEPV